jgi:Uma2 family endonuclease
MAQLTAIAAPSIRPAHWEQAREWTYEDYLNLPDDDGHRYEIIEGVLYMANAPDIDHQYAVVELIFQLKHFVTEHRLGYILTALFEVHLSAKTRPVQPDVLFIRADRWPGAGAKFFEGAPDLVVEVISPGSTRLDQVVKWNSYEQAGVPEYWLVHPKSRSVQVFTLVEGEYALLGEFVGDEPIESQVLAGLTIVAGTLFSPGVGGG